MDWKEIIKENDRYKNFTILDEPIEFKDLFKDEDIKTVQLHSIETYTVADVTVIGGFCGSFKWKNNSIESIDNDSYTARMLVYGYERFNNGVDVLVKSW